MWARLHGKPFSEEDEEIDDELDSKGAEEASQNDIASEEEHTGAGSTDQESEDEESIDLSQSHGAKRKRSIDERETKRPRVVGL
jgi:hypothetical protein